ncbi:hypothetical protein GGP41_009213 [Bipolaris sorokiniana]|uniref:Uncharacterized protein n=2 Tax=Cochliobolus sativus TaxID=45130 RepID=A0A8H6DTY7_COCSA|nr:uncharacterized protein COCSADRAFT_41209 [Bipolaris sorokiniana ND90Pr]EMD59348.1 hypothetical protein COCSADRAFT_41209 [Bipolaris sorokiniana ND90Pr]KAF5847952.1 hypothetical protein GGP41_009213 [Bipolaris sorokiniana]
MTVSSYKPQNLSSTPKSVAPADLFLLRVDLASTQYQQRLMAHDNHRPSPLRPANELWYNIPASASRHQEEEEDGPELSAYQATAHRFSSYSSHPTTPLRSPPIINSDLNKPLPPSPSNSERKPSKYSTLFGLLRREPPRQLDSTLLQPEPYQSNQRHSTDLSVETHVRYSHIHSRSMPNSPRGFIQSSCSSAEHLPQTQFPATDFSETFHYQPYSTPPQNPSSLSQQRRTVSSDAHLEMISPRTRTFPDPTLNSTPRDTAPSRPRPHTTCLSPTEPFTDMSQFHLFAEAMTGLPSDTEPFSPSAPPQLRGSLFARRSTNDSIPLPLQHPQESCAPPMRRPQREQRDDWQNFEPLPLISSLAAPALNDPQPSLDMFVDSYQPWQPPPQMDEVNAELELLGLNDPLRGDDELPNYQQSQEEMAERKRLEAAARARELEAQWRRTRR